MGIEQGFNSGSVSPRCHILSVDVEDYFMVEAFAGSVSRDTWESWPSRVAMSTRLALDLFDKHNVKGTFFFVGWVAQKFPDLVREVHACGHELACHSYWHRPVYSLTPTEFRADTRRAKDVVEQTAGVRVLGYRAPSWSITKGCVWALDILAEEGFVYDSSVYPIYHDLYGIPDARRFGYAHQCSNGAQLREIPPTTVRLFGLNLAAAGGGYLRIFPMVYTQWVFRHIESRHGQPVVVYFHPWELDPEQPRIPARLRSRIRHYLNLRRMQPRLVRLLKTHSFQPMSSLLRTTREQGQQKGESSFHKMQFRVGQRPDDCHAWHSNLLEDNDLK
jgi:polysaccharide deacetylase family protein (PEP-CTERM system associated)